MANSNPVKRYHGYHILTCLEKKISPSSLTGKEKFKMANCVKCYFYGWFHQVAVGWIRKDKFRIFDQLGNMISCLDVYFCFQSYGGIKHLLNSVKNPTEGKVMHLFHWFRFPCYWQNSFQGVCLTFLR